MLDLGELADELQELLDAQERVKEPDNEYYSFDMEDEERLEELQKFNDEIGCVLDVKQRASFVQVVPDEQKAKENYGYQIVADLVDGEIPGVIRPHIDYAAVADDFLSNWLLIQWEGKGYWLDV